MLRIARLVFFGAALLPLSGGLARGGDAAVAVPDARRLCLAGDALFRQAKFEDAERAYQAALAADPDSARAHWGLGRMATLESRTVAARDHFSAAYQLDPRDPDIVLSFADWVQTAASRKVLLENYLVLAGSRDPLRRDDVRARLHVLERLGCGQPAKLATPYQRYRFRLTAFLPDGQNQSGLLLAVSVNGGKPLHLLLDSGADGIVVNASRVKDARLEELVAAQVDGLGASGAAPAHLSLAHSVTIGKLRLENCLLHVADRDLTPGADGVVGANLFQDFLLRLDLPAYTLDLIPFPERPDSLPQASPSAAMVRLSHWILLRTAVDARSDGYFLLDTGSSFTAVSRDDADAAAAPDGRSLRGAAGEFSALHSLPPIRVDLAGNRLADEHPVALDLRQISRMAGAEIAGIAGYPLLRNSVVLIDYRDGRVAIQR